ncbi:hypothetical protein ACFLQM_01685 [Acidobacteriota bacterium]
MGSRGKTVALWIAAFAVTVLLAVFQRMTGPSYPIRGIASLPAGESLSYSLPRSNEGRETLRIAIAAPSNATRAKLEWRRFPTDEPFRGQAMTANAEGEFETRIPPQPAAGKVEYRILLEFPDGSISIPTSEAVVARYRASVPAYVLIPHILAMFLSMLVSSRALFEVLRPGAPRARNLVLVSMALLVVGGLMLGPVVQKFAFGAFWTGWPYGHDLTDNKTLIAFLAWLPATILAWRRAKTRLAVALGWVVMMGIFLIPHSARGSQLDWSEVEPVTEDSGYQIQ